MCRYATKTQHSNLQYFSDDLVCVIREGDEFVPGCTGNGEPRDILAKNVCTDPANFSTSNSLTIDLIDNLSLQQFVLFTDINRIRTEVTSRNQIFICDNGGDLLCDDTYSSKHNTLWTTEGLKRVSSTSKYIAYQLHIYNVGTGRFFTPYYGDDKVKMVDDPAKADLWTFEYGEDGVVIIHPGDSYDEALCMMKDGNGFYYKRGLGDELPTQDLMRLEENCQFPTFGRGVSFPL